MSEKCQLRQRSVTLTFIEFVILSSLLNLFSVSVTYLCGLRCEPRGPIIQKVIADCIQDAP